MCIFHSFIWFTLSVCLSIYDNYEFLVFGFFMVFLVGGFSVVWCLELFFPVCLTDKVHQKTI